MHTQQKHICAIFVMAFALFGFGCSTPVVQSIAFNEADFKPYDAAGTASIAGHAFVRSDNGAKHGAAGITINLVPLTSYTEERAKIMASEKDPAPADPRLEKYIKTTVGDWGGAYRFRGLAPGNYLLYCKIEWHRRHDGGEYYALARAEVSSGEHKNVVITHLEK